MTGRGQSLVELAVALPAVVMLALGAAALLRLADAKSGLDGATAVAVADAARQGSAAAAERCGTQRFAEIAAEYPLTQPRVALSGTFTRGSVYAASATAQVDLSFVPLWFLPRAMSIRSQASALVEPWRSRAQQPCGYSSRAA
jgi:Flp pilus assembly protein TadG